VSWQGKQLGNYKLEELIGKGGFGEVYRATETGLDRNVAVKILIGPEDFSDSARAKLLERFSQEARLIASLDHYNILPIFAYSHSEGTPYLVMPMMDKSLSHKLKESNGRIPFERVMYYTQSVCAGLQYAHERNIIHRDIKPPNILLSRDEARVVLADFGIARILSNVEDYTSTSVVIGSPLYMAPEQQSGTVGRRTDIYSLGLTVYELLTGYLPREHIYKPLVPPSRLRGDIPPVIDPIILRATAKDPDERFATPLEFANALYNALASVGIHNFKTAPVPHAGLDTATQAVPVRPTNPNRTDPLHVYPPTPNPLVPPTNPQPLYTQPTVNITPNSRTPNNLTPNGYTPNQVQNITPPAITPVPPVTEEKKEEKKRGIYFSCSVVFGAVIALAAAVAILILANSNANNPGSGSAATSVAVISTPTIANSNIEPPAISTRQPVPPTTVPPTTVPVPGIAPTNLPVTSIASAPTPTSPAQPSPTPRSFAVLGLAVLNRNTDQPQPSDSVTSAYLNQPLYLYIQVGGQTQPEDLIIKGLPGGDVPVQVQPGQNAFVFPLEQGLPLGSYQISLLFLGQETGNVVELSVTPAPTPTPTPIRTTAPPVQVTQPPTQVTQPPTATDTPIPARPPGTIVVTVQSSAGRLLSGIAVRISGAGGSASGTTSNGVFSASLAEGNYNISVACTGGTVQSSSRAISGGTISVTIRCT
jgi:serine/threonine protein kinase